MDGRDPSLRIRIALSTPSLWKNVYARHNRRALDPDSENEDGERSTSNDEEDYAYPIMLIGRSQPASLNLSCEVNVLPPDHEEEEPDRLYNSLRNNVHRLQRFHLSNASYLNQTLLDILDTPFPHLSSLQICVEDFKERKRDIDTGLILSDVQAEQIELPRLFGGAPSNLRKLSLWGYTSWPYNTFPKLTHLSLHEQLTTPTLHQFLDILEALPLLEVLHLERAGPEIPSATTYLPQRRVCLAHLREARFLVFETNPMNIQHRILECIATPPFIEILFSLPNSDARNLRKLLPGFPFSEKVTDIKIIPPDKDYPCAAVKVFQKTQLIIQTGSIVFETYISSFGAQFPRLANISFQSMRLPFRRASELFNFNNLVTITIHHALCFLDIPPLISLLKDQTSDDMLCPQLLQITIYASEEYYASSSLMSGRFAEELFNNPRKVVLREPNKEFVVLLIKENQKQESPIVRWTKRW